MWDKSAVRLHCGKFVFLFSAHPSIHPSSLGPCRFVHRSFLLWYVRSTFLVFTGQRSAHWVWVWLVRRRKGNPLGWAVASTMWLVGFNHCGSHFRIVCFACLLVSWLVGGVDLELVFRLGWGLYILFFCLWVVLRSYFLGGWHTVYCVSGEICITAK